MSGQISLCQASFAGVGAFTAGQLAMHFDTPVLLGAVAGGAARPPSSAAGVAAHAAPRRDRPGPADPVVRPRGATTCCSSTRGRATGPLASSCPRPTIVGSSFAGNGAFFWLALVVLVLAAGAVWLVQHGTIGEELTAFRGSETGAASIGIDVRRLRVIAFALSAALPGIGGALYASLQQTVSPTDFNYQFSLVFVVVVATVGVYSIAGAIEAGLAYTVLQQAISNLPSRYSSLLALVFGLAALTYVRHPEGVVASPSGGCSTGPSSSPTSCNATTYRARRATPRRAPAPTPDGS